MSATEIASAEDNLTGRGISDGGFKPFKTAQSKDHLFEIWLRPPVVAGRTAWKAAVVSRGQVNLATAYVAEDGVLRASVPILDPRGHLLFRAGTTRGVPTSGPDFQCKFGAA